MYQAGPSRSRSFSHGGTSRLYPSRSASAFGSFGKCADVVPFEARRRRVMAASNVYDTESLVRRYNESEDSGEKEVYMDLFRRHVEYFQNQQEEPSDENWKLYTELGNIKCSTMTPAEDTFWLTWLNSILKRVNSSNVFAARSLSKALQMIPHEAFVGKISPLTTIVSQLLDLLNPAVIGLTKRNYSLLEPMFLALYQTFFNMFKAAGKVLNKQEQYYKFVYNRLKEIKRKQSYYPIYFLVCLVEHGLSLVKNDKNTTGLSRLLTRRLSKTTTIRTKNTRDLKKEKEFDINLDISWYNNVRRLVNLAARGFFDATLINELHEDMKLQLKNNQSRLSYLHDIKAMQYAMIRYFGLLTYECQSVLDRKRAMEWLLDIAEKYKLKEWGIDVDIYEALLNTLGQFHSKVDDNEKKIIETSIEVMTHNDNLKLTECYNAWLGTLPLEKKLYSFIQHLGRPNQDTLFDHVVDEVEVYTFREVQELQRELRLHYFQDDFPIVSCFFNKRANQHVKDLEFSIRRILNFKKKIEENDENLDCEDDQDLQHNKQDCIVSENLEIEDLFTPKSLIEPKLKQEINNVFIYGSPRVGKTSLVKKLAYLWSIDKWGKEFKYVFVVEVKNIKSKTYIGSRERNGPALHIAIINNCFTYRDKKEFVLLRNHIQDVLQEKTTLVILDGFDARDGVCHEIVEEAKHCKCRVLLCGRSLNLDEERKLVDYKAKCVGLDDQQLTRFIKKEVVHGSHDELISLTKDNFKLWNWARIPIIANIICFLWENDKESKKIEKTFQSIYSVYTEVVGCMCQTLVSEQESRKHKEEVLQSLGKIAFEAYHVGKILIHPIIVDAHTSLSTKESIQDCGFLLLNIEGTHFHFPHLTFLEYFVGEHLAYCLEEGNRKKQDIAKRFIKENRYTPSCEVIMNMLIESLASKGSMEFDELISIIDDGVENVLAWKHSLFKFWVLDKWIGSSYQTMREVEYSNRSVRKIKAEVRQIIRYSFSDVDQLKIIVDNLK